MKKQVARPFQIITGVSLFHDPDVQLSELNLLSDQAFKCLFRRF